MVQSEFYRHAEPAKALNTSTSHTQPSWEVQWWYPFLLLILGLVICGVTIIGPLLADGPSTNLMRLSWIGGLMIGQAILMMKTGLTIPYILGIHPVLYICSGFVAVGLSTLSCYALISNLPRDDRYALLAVM